MPIYDYRCDPCGHAFSAVQSYTDETLDTCPRCGARPRKLMTSPAIVFKGSGWYKTDSRRGSADAKADAKADGQVDAKPEGKAAATESAAPSAGASDTPSRTDAKPAPKAKAKAEAPKEPAS